MNLMKKMKFTRQPETGCLSEQDAKNYFTVIGFAVFFLMLIFYVGSSALAILIQWFFPSVISHPIAAHAVSLVALYGLAFPVFYLILSRLPRGIPAGESMSGGDVVGALGMTFLVMMAGNTVGQWLIAVFENGMGVAQENPVAESTTGVAWWINLIFVALIPCIFEELVFRKILCDRLLPLGEGYAVVISAAAFGLVHGNFFQFFYAFAVGLVFGVIYVKTGKIWLTMIYHGIVNTLGGVLAPILLERLTPIMSESGLEQINEYMDAGNAEALAEMLTPYMLPMMGLLLYEGVMFAALVGGFVYFWKKGRKIRFEAGLLPVPRGCRVSAVFLNVGTAAALTLFAGIFLFSLL